MRKTNRSPSRMDMESRPLLPIPHNTETMPTMTDEETRAKWREKSARRYEQIKLDPVAYQRYVDRMRENARKRSGTDPDQYRGKHKLGPTRKQKAKLIVREIKIAAKHCHDCRLEITETTLYRFEFDHRDPMTKRFALSAPQGYSEQTIREEAAKCDVVCRNCHADRTHGPQAKTIRAKQSLARKKQLLAKKTN